MPPRWGTQHWYIVSVTLAGLVAVGSAIPRVTLPVALGVILAVAVAEWFSVTVRDDMFVSLTNLVVLVVIVVAGPAAAVVAVLGILPSILVRAADQRVLRTSFNVSQLALSTTAAGVAYQGTLQLLDASFPSVVGIATVGLAASIYSLINHVLVAGVVSLSSPDSFLSTLWSTIPAILMQVLSSAGLAVFAAVLWLQSPWAILFVAVPVLVARYALTTFQQLDTAYDELVRGFVTAIELKDLYTRGHSERVSELSVLVAEELGIAYEQRRLTRYAALLHDVGKVGVPLCVINKAGPLDDHEFAEIQKHPTIGAEILRDIDFLAPAIDIVRFHHERLDGKGYPHGVKEEELSDIVRIVTAVDAFDAMTSTRSYRQALSIEAAIAELRRCAGRQFDPRMVEALAKVVDRVGWTPTTDFASEAQLHGEHIPIGTAQERLSAAQRDASSQRDRSELSP